MSKLRIALFMCVSVLLSGFSAGLVFAQDRDHDRDDRRVVDRDHDRGHKHHKKHKKHKRNDHDRNDRNRDRDRDRDHDRH